MLIDFDAIALLKLIYNHDKVIILNEKFVIINVNGYYTVMLCIKGFLPKSIFGDISPWKKRITYSKDSRGNIFLISTNFDDECQVVLITSDSFEILTENATITKVTTK